MKSILKTFLILTLLHLTFINPLYAFEMKDRNEYLIDTRGDDGDIYLNRLSLHKKLDPLNMEISAFGEVQWNFQTDEWEKIILGMGADKWFWKYLCVGQSIQFISGEILDYMVFNVNSNSIDTTTRIAFYLSFLKDFSFSIFEEFSLNIEKGRGEYCETGAEILYRPVDSCSIGIGWRHTDRIHNFDTDYVSASITLHF